jgi:hypothetical protein
MTYTLLFLHFQIKTLSFVKINGKDDGSPCPNNKNQIISKMGELSSLNFAIDLEGPKSTYSCIFRAKDYI